MKTRVEARLCVTILSGYVGVVYGIYRVDGKENGNYYLGFRVEGFGGYTYFLGFANGKIQAGCHYLFLDSVLFWAPQYCLGFRVQGSETGLSV